MEYLEVESVTAIRGLGGQKVCQGQWKPGRDKKYRSRHFEPGMSFCATDFDTDSSTGIHRMAMFGGKDECVAENGMLS